jgi:hypothetical protein
LQLIKIHRLLIGSGIGLCLLITLLQGRQYVNSGDHRALIRMGVAALAGAALYLYFRSIRTL